LSVREAERTLSGVLLSRGARSPLVALFFLGAITVTIGSLRPELSVPGPEEASWVVHFIAYSGLAVIGAFAFPGRGRLLPVAVGLVALGIAIEFAQLYVPGRYGTVDDGIVDICGVAFGCFVSQRLKRRWLAG
jgi:VanZ family protein